KYFCNHRKTTITGKVTSADAAIVLPQSTSNIEENSVNPTGSVRADSDVVSIEANTNSFHEIIKAYIPVAAKPGAAKGRVTLNKAPKWEHPSTIAASSNSFGMLIK